MKIGIDLDETLFGFIEEMIPMYNKKYNDNVKFKDLKDYDISKSIKISSKQFFDDFATEETFNKIKVYTNAVNVINEFHRHSDVYFVTAGHSSTMYWRMKKLEKVFPWFKDGNLIKCKNKQLLDLDVLIDDNVDNLRGGKYTGILFSQPWNMNETEFLRINSWNEIKIG